MKYFTQKSLTLLGVLSFIALITFYILYQLVSSKEYKKLLFQEQIIQEAKAHFKGMLDTRTWNAQYGGVYVKATSGLEPNPYLKNNTLYTDKKELLIKINPAWMTRQISEISNANGSYHFKITSLKPLNPSNEADVFEKKALAYFNANKNEKYFYNFNSEGKNFNFMGALPTTASCLQCHAHQGYKVGDIRGGIRVSIPLSLHQKQIDLLEETSKNSIMIVLCISFALMAMSYWFIQMIYKRKYEIEHANEILEGKVQERTQDLEIIVTHEQHLKIF